MFIVPPEFNWSALDPRTWPWMVWVWLGILGLANTKSTWEWYQRKRAESWPIAAGRIESAVVLKKTGMARSKSSPYYACIGYSYAVGGETTGGSHKRDMAGEEEGEEFIRELVGQSIEVHYEPANIHRSVLSDAALDTLAARRPPSPLYLEAIQRRTSIPQWIRFLLWPVAALAAAGLGLSVWVHIAALRGMQVLPGWAFAALHAGLFAVGLPTMLVGNRVTAGAGQDGFWKAVTGGSDILRYIIYVFFAYALVNFMILVGTAFQQPKHNGLTLEEWRGFSGHWMVFYAVASVVLYAAASGRSGSPDN